MSEVLNSLREFGYSLFNNGIVSALIYPFIVGIGFGLYGIGDYIDKHPRKSLRNKVENYERMFLERYGVIPPEFQKKANTHSELKERQKKYESMLKKN